MGDQEELQRLRRDLYRPDPPAGTRERYEALRARLAPEPPPQEPRPTAEEAAGPEAAAAEPAVAEEGGRRPARRRGRVVVAGLVAAVVGTGAVAAALAANADRGGAAPLAEALSSGDSARLERALSPGARPWGPPGAGTTVLAVLRRADLPQLQVWDRREAFAWVQRGTGPLHRVIGEQRSGRAVAQPLSVVVRCGSEADYAWTVRGVAPGSTAVRELASGTAARCDRPTVSSGTLPAGSRVTAFDLRVPTGVRWAMAVVVPDEP